MSSRHAGFTLLEIVLALAIAVMIIVLAVPGIAGLLAEQRLKRSFERFDQLVGKAKLRSMTEQRGQALVWDAEGITLLAGEQSETGSPEASEERITFEKDESWTIERPAALIKNPPSVWPFWRNGTCEPAIITFKGPDGSWVVRYDPLTAHGTFVSSEVP